MFKFTLAALLAAISAVWAARAEEALSLEGGAEASVSLAEVSTRVLADEPWLWIGPGSNEAVAYLLSTAGLLLAVGGPVMLINKATLKRMYRDAAAEATRLMVEHPDRPLDFAVAGGSLAKVIQRERLVSARRRYPIDTLSEPNLANLIIARARQLNGK